MAHCLSDRFELNRSLDCPLIRRPARSRNSLPRANGTTRKPLKSITRTAVSLTYALISCCHGESKRVEHM
jgi:hypothetical protein